MDGVTILREWDCSQPFPLGPDTTDITDAKHGVAYFIVACNRDDGTVELIKIGCSKNVEYRLSQLQATAGMYRLALVAATCGGSDQERAYHRRFATHRQDREWFYPAPEILAEIERITGGLA